MAVPSVLEILVQVLAQKSQSLIRVRHAITLVTYVSDVKEACGERLLVRECDRLPLVLQLT